MNQKILRAAMLAVAGIAWTSQVGARTCFSPEVMFEFNSTEMIASSVANLDRVIRNMIPDGNGLEVVVLNGHASRGEVRARWLSTRRGEQVKRHLEEQGVDGRRIHVQAYGDAQAVADNATATGRARNQRVDIDIVQAPVPEDADYTFGPCGERWPKRVTRP